jgi:hypothetical protein
VGSASSLVAYTHAGYVATGYAIALASLAGYVILLSIRSRRARARSAAVAAKRAGTS